MWNVINPEIQWLLDQNKGTRIQVQILNGDVRVEVKYSVPINPEDKSIADYIEECIKKGFKEYNTDRKIKSIEI